MADNRPIGVFDSGLGGLTVLKEIEKILPNENIVYFGDTGRVPYGNKSDEIIRQYAVQDENFLLSHDVKFIVAACGTVSAVAADTALTLPVPFMGVVETAVKDAVSTTRNGKIGVIGTEATINNGAHKKSILRLMPEIEVYTKACPLFVPLVEEGFFLPSDNLVLETAERYLKEMLEADVDTIILGCTHYPLLSEVISLIAGKEVALINTGISTAKELKEALTSKAMLNDGNTAPSREFYVSDKTAAFSKVAKILLGSEINDISVKVADVSKI